jgi:cytochrome c oxidase subunit 2
MEKLLILLVVILGIVAIGQYMRVYQLAAEVRGKRQEDISTFDNKMNANLMLIFMVAFFAFFIWLLAKYGEGGLGPAASEHGEKTDWLLNLNFQIIIAVFFLTQALLFIFAWKYYYRPDRKALFYPHNNKLELLWTVVPSIVLAVIIILGLKTWNSIMFPDEDSEVTYIEVYAEQFAWTARYSGADNILGKADYKLKSPDNPLGVITTASIKARFELMKKDRDAAVAQLENDILPDWQVMELEDKISRIDRLEMRLKDLEAVMKEDSVNWDERAGDDVVTNEIHMIVGKEYEFNFRAQDVIHSAYFPHFRAQMNCVPGMTTKFRFKPIITTAEMRAKMNNPKFDYILLCNKICGAGHNAMSMKVVVETEEEYNAWLNAQTRFDGKKVGGDAPAAEEAPADSTATSDTSNVVFQDTTTMAEAGQ